jgi:hypothetical protein
MPLEKRGFLRRTGFMEGTGPDADTAGTTQMTRSGSRLTSKRYLSHPPSLDHPFDALKSPASKYRRDGESAGFGSPVE